MPLKYALANSNSLFHPSSFLLHPLPFILSYEEGDVFDVWSVGELVDGLEGDDGVAKSGAVGRLGNGVAGDIDNFFGIELVEEGYGSRAKTDAGWIDNDSVGW